MSNLRIEFAKSLISSAILSLLIGSTAFLALEMTQQHAECEKQNQANRKSIADLRRKFDSEYQSILRIDEQVKLLILHPEP